MKLKDAITKLKSTKPVPVLALIPLVATNVYFASRVLLGTLFSRPRR